MPEQLELDLTRALAEASRVPVPDDLHARVERRGRVRRRRRIGTGAAILALSAPALLPSLGGTPTVSSSPPPSSSAAATPSVAASAASPSVSPPPSASEPLKIPSTTAGAKPIDQVWPNGIVRIPNSLKLAVVGLLDRDHALATSEDRFEHVSALYSFDLRDQSSVKLADLGDPPGARDYRTQGFAFTATEILWWGQSLNAMYFWSLSRSGGTPRLIAKVGGAVELDDMSATDDAFYWTGMNGGVYRFDRRAGTLAVVPGMENYRITVFPWATSPDRAPTLHNLLTDEEILVRAPADTSSLWCVPALCIGEGGPAYSHFAMRVDGSQRVDLMDADLRTGLIAGRYVLALNRGGTDLIIDVRTGRIAALPGGAQVSHDVVFWLEADAVEIFFPTRA